VEVNNLLNLVHIDKLIIDGLSVFIMGRVMVGLSSHGCEWVER